MNYRKDKYFIIVTVAFCVIYCLISFVNHYNFRTYALDLGLYTNALYDYIRFQWNDSTVFKVTAENLLADHFDLYLIIFSPLSLLFGSYTLLIIQIFFILLGGLGVYTYFRSYKNTNNLALPAAVFFYLFFGVFSAVSNDYHSNVIAATLVPWLFYYFKGRRIISASILLVLILVSKENTSLWMAFVCLGLVFEYRKDKLLRNYSLAAALICLAYFVMITSLIMPALANSNTYPHFRYAVLGESPFDSLIGLISHPVESIKTLFVNHTGHPSGDYVKAELHILVLISGLPLLLRKPQYLIMLIPVYFQKLFHDNYMMWSIDGQYSIEFAPILAIGVFSSISSFRSQRIAYWTTIAVLVAVLACTIRIMDNTVIFTNKTKIRLYKASHYSRDYDVTIVHDLLSSLPKDAIVSAQSQFLPHLALRDHIYQFPIIKDAEYIVYSCVEDTYPMDRYDFEILTRGLEEFSTWKVHYKSDFLTILKKN